MSSKNDLEEAAKHLFYEVWMLDKNVEFLESATPPDGPSPNYNARLESFLVHLRSLIDFFYKEPRDDDMGAVQFLPDSKDWTPPDSERKALREARSRTNKELAHLTHDRVGKTLSEKEWDFPDLHARIWRVMERFLDDADDEKLGDVAAALRKLQSELEADRAVGTPTANTSSEFTQRFGGKGLTQSTSIAGGAGDSDAEEDVFATEEH